MGGKGPGSTAGNCHCGKEGIVYLPYSCKHLCEPHFIRMFDKRFRKTVRTMGMLKKGDKVAIGLSGGKDSTVLLHSLAGLKKDLPIELLAITIDEGIKGYRPKTMVAAKRECENLGVGLHVYSFKELCGKTLDDLVGDTRARKSGGGNALPCSQCGVLRRYALNRAARELGATKLAIGHNLDDIAQTVIMNIMKNEPARLARLNDPIIKSASFVPRIRPLMLTPEKEIAIYAMMKGIAIERIECPYAYTAFRQHTRRMLNETEERYPGTKFKIVNSFLEMEDALRSKYAKGAKINECGRCGEPSSNDICQFCALTNFRKNLPESEIR
jgi:uncharacterized protein (TIGR00269 family)